MHWLLPLIIFYVFAGLTVLSALMVVTQNNPVRCVLFLVLTFFSSSVLWMLVHSEFLALILVLVYVGAVMTLFLFVVMMLNIDQESKHPHLIHYLPFGLVIVALLTGLLLVALPPGTFNTGVDESVKAREVFETSASRAGIHFIEKPSNTEALGLVLYTDYVLAFELAAVILLVAIIAAITLVHRNFSRSKQQDVVRQIMTRREDRITLIDIKPDSPGSFPDQP